MRRRSFLAGMVAAGAAPWFAIGAPKRKRLVRIGLIGCGGRMAASTEYGILNFMCGPDEEIVCMCDPDPSAFDRVRAIVKERQSAEAATKIRAFNDYREMLDSMGDRLDAVAIATPNHHHAPAALMAMQKGLHIYVEKPLALTIEEVGILQERQRQSGVVIQVGNQGHSAEGMKRLVELVQSGELGQIREVWAFDDRVNAMTYRPKSAPPPKGMDWNAWCGPAPLCDYYPTDGNFPALHPHDWHSWIGYGNGSIGNMGTHVLDPAFWALKLGSVHPTSVEALDIAPGCPGSWAWRNTIRWQFPGREGLDPVTLYWYDGAKNKEYMTPKHLDRIGTFQQRNWQNLPPIVEQLEQRYNANLGAIGTIYVGEKGTLAFGPHGSGLRFLPDTLRQTLGKVPKTLPRTKGLDHVGDWLRAVRDPFSPPSCDLDYSAPLATTVLLGNVAARAGKRKLEWDGTQVVNHPDANAYLKTTYRKGWELPA